MTPRNDLADTTTPDMKADRIGLTLYRMVTKADMPASWLLSPTGLYADAKPVARKLVDVPATLAPVKVGGKASERGLFHIEKWKAAELGWLTSDDDRQERLL
jgi:hypothetical protein